MMMLPMLTEETPTYICFSGFDCAEAGTGKVNMTAHISAADVMLRKGSLRARDIVTSKRTATTLCCMDRSNRRVFFLAPLQAMRKWSKSFLQRPCHIPEPIPEFACKSCALQLEY